MIYLCYLLEKNAAIHLGHDQIDKNEIEKEMFLAVNSVSDNLPTQSEAENVVDATAVFARKRYSNEFKWIPSPEIEKAIADMIFKNTHR